jgi:sec-independent protein translocase protein TatB
VLNFSPEKLMLVGLIALIVLGPTRLPQAARSAGRLMAQLRQMSEGFQHEVRGALQEPVDSVKSVTGDFRVPDVRRMVRDTISTTLNPDPASPASPTQDRPASPATPVVPPAPDDPSLN